MIWQERLHKYSLWAAIIVLPWQLRHTFLFAYHNGEFFEYASLSFYLSDIIIAWLLILWAIKVFFQAKDFTWGPKLISFPLTMWLLWLWIQVIMVNYAGENTAVAMLAAGHFTLFAGFYLYLINHVKNIKDLLWPILIGVGIQNIVAISQYFANKSLGWKWLGESVLDPEELGIPVVLKNGIRQLRAHGTLPHANALGGVLAYLIIVLLAWCGVIKENWQRSIVWGVLVISVVAIIFSFSRSAWLAMALASLVLLIIAVMLKNQLTKINLWHWLIAIIVIFGVVVSQWSAINSRFDINQSNIEQESIVSRIGQWDQFKQAFTVAPWIGVGLAQYTLKLEQDDIKSFGWRYDNSSVSWKYYIGHQVWDYQPIHNIYLLHTAETGLIGGLLFVWLLLAGLIVGWQSAWRTRNLLGWGIWLAYLALLFIGLFDHYLLTLQQGRLVLFLSIGLVSIYSINQQLYDGRKSN